LTARSDTAATGARRFGGLLAGLGLLLGAACSGPGRASSGVALFDGGAAPEVLVEEGAVGGPLSERANRFFQGWAPTDVGGAKRGLRLAAGGASFQLVTLTERERTLALDLAPPPGDLADSAAARPGHVRVRVDRGPAFLVPFADPLPVRLPAGLARGRHLVELSPPGADAAPLVVLDAAVRPAAQGGAARIDGSDLVLEGPAMADRVAEPRAGWVLSGEVCPRGAFASTRELAVDVTGEGERAIGRWSGGAGVLDRLRGCRRVELPPVPAAGPVRVRFTAAEPGSAARWRGWRWRPEPAKTPPPAPMTEAPAPSPSRRPRLVVLYVMDALRADTVGHLGGPPGISPTIDRLAREGFTFRDHRSTAPNTLLSVRHLFTGRILVNTEDWRRLSVGGGAALPTLAEAFQAAGYRTGLFSANGYVSAHYGLARGFDHVSQEALFDVESPGPAPVNRSAERVHAASPRPSGATRRRCATSCGAGAPPRPPTASGCAASTGPRSPTTTASSPACSTPSGGGSGRRRAWSSSPPTTARSCSTTAGCCTATPSTRSCSASRWWCGGRGT
jgi:hypothetical protein